MFSFVKIIEILVMRNSSQFQKCVLALSQLLVKRLFFCQVNSVQFVVPQHFTALLTSGASITLQLELGTAPRICRDLCMHRLMPRGCFLSKEPVLGLMLQCSGISC